MTLAPLLRRRAWSPTVGIAVLVAGLVVVVAILRQEVTITLLFDLLLCAFAALSGPFLRVGGALTFGFLAAVVIASGTVGLSAYAALLPVLSASIAGRRWLRLGYAMAAFVLLMALTARTLRPDESIADYAIVWFGLVAAAWLFGDAIRALIETSARRWRDELEAQRLRIARDLHDTVAHALSLIVMRTEQARLAGGATNDDLDFVASTADQSIHDLRSMLTLLRSTEFSAGEADTWAASHLHHVLEASMARLRAEGFHPSLAVEGDLTRLSPSVDDALGKIAHEATTNIIRHGAPGSRCALMVAVDDTSVELVVTNVPGRAPRQDLDHLPLGVIGMRERAQAVGGEFSAGLGAHRWITRATVPLGSTRIRREAGSLPPWGPPAHDG